MNKDITHRFNLLFRISGCSKKEFAKLLDISPSALHAYLNGDYNVQKIAYKLSEFGFSLDWLFTGIGQPYINETKFNKKIEVDYKSFYADLQNWIQNNYQSILNFEIERNIKIGYLKKIIDENMSMPYKMILKLRNAGYNYNPFKFLK